MKPKPPTQSGSHRTTIRIDTSTSLRKRIYFASDLHLGSPTWAESKQRELKFVQWLDEIKPDAHSIFLLGDLFDFWFEYKTAIPKGGTRLLGKLCEIVDAGIDIYFFVGNHDLWIRDYFEKEIGMTCYNVPQLCHIDDKHMVIGHGDGLGSREKLFRFQRFFFRNSFLQYLYSLLPVDVALTLGSRISGVSRKKNTKKGEDEYLGDDKEHIMEYCLKYHNASPIPIDFFIFGHRHLMLDRKVGGGSRYINIGDWISNFSYAMYYKDGLSLNTFVK